MTDQEKAEAKAILYRDVGIAKRVDQFLQGEFWTKVFDEYLSEECQDLLEVSIFKPTDIPDLNRLALLNAYNSGKRDALLGLRDQFDDWREKGARAAKVLAEGDK